MTDFDLTEETRKAMVRPLRSARLAGSSRALLQTDADLEGHYGDESYQPYRLDEPLSDAVLAAGAHQDAEADRLYDDDRTLTGEVPPGYDSRLFGRDEW